MADADRQSFDPYAALAEVQHATERFVRSIEPLDAATLAAPSLLPGWSRGHVCAHVDGNADSLVNLLVAARTGEVVPQYASDEARDAAIEAGASRTPLEHVAAVRASAERFAEAAAQLTDPAWSEVVTWRGGARRPAHTILWARLREVEIHHVDLDLDYTAAHWAEDFADHVLANAVSAFRQLDPPPDFALHSVDTDRRWQFREAAPTTVVSGAEAALLAWLIGRSSGDGLSVDGPQGHTTPLPTPPPWL